MSELELLVGGRRYEGWKSIRVTRSIESLAGSFALEVSDRWANQEIPWPIAEGDRCRVLIDGAGVITGYVGKRSQAMSADKRSLAYTGRDRAAALVDCSCLLTKWTYRNITLAELATTLAAPFDVKVSVQPGLTLSKQPKIVIQPGDTPFEVLQRWTSADGVMVVSDGTGGLVITRSGTVRAASLVQGGNVLTASVDYDGDDRFYRYVVMSSIAGTDEAPGEATRVMAEAIDEGVTRRDRVLLIRADKGYNVADARRRADWEARIRAARAETVMVGVVGWQQSREPGGQTGKLWPINAISYVKIPAIGVDGDMLISQVEHSISDGGQLTQLRLVRPDALTPEPKAVVKSGGPGLAWKDAAGASL